MPDLLDQIQTQQDMLHSINLANAHRPAPSHTGFCHNCDEPLAGWVDTNFCDSDCREDYERRESAQLRQRGVI